MKLASKLRTISEENDYKNYRTFSYEQIVLLLKESAEAGCYSYGFDGLLKPSMIDRLRKEHLIVEGDEFTVVSWT